MDININEEALLAIIVVLITALTYVWYLRNVEKKCYENERKLGELVKEQKDDVMHFKDEVNRKFEELSSKIQDIEFDAVRNRNCPNCNGTSGIGSIESLVQNWDLRGYGRMSLRSSSRSVATENDDISYTEQDIQDDMHSIEDRVRHASGDTMTDSRVNYGDNFISDLNDEEDQRTLTRNENRQRPRIAMERFQIGLPE